MSLSGDRTTISKRQWMKVISFNLASVRRKLPESDFIRIHRSRIVNLRHVEGDGFEVAVQW